MCTFTQIMLRNGYFHPKYFTAFKFENWVKFYAEIIYNRRDTKLKPKLYVPCQIELFSPGT